MNKEIRLTPEGQDIDGWTKFVECIGNGNGYRLVEHTVEELDDYASDISLSNAEALAFALQLPEIKALIAALRAVEWVMGEDAHDAGWDYCVWCQNLRRYEHAPGCQRQAALAALEVDDATD